MDVDTTARSQSNPGTLDKQKSDAEFTLQRDALKLTVCKRSGKITHLEAFGASWLVEPSEADRDHLFSGAAGREDTFTIAHAWGADECVPSVGAFTGIVRDTDASASRDHGALWGRACNITSQSTTQASCRWELAGHAQPMLDRNISVEAGNELRVEVAFPSHVTLAKGGPVLETLYAFHSLFEMHSGSKLVLSHSGSPVFEATLPDASKKIARKFFARADTGVITHPDGRTLTLTLEEGLPYFGVWWCNNAWGDGRPHRTVGLEPTSHASDGPILRTFASGHPVPEPGIVHARFSLAFSPPNPSHIKTPTSGLSTPAR